MDIFFFLFNFSDQQGYKVLIIMLKSYFAGVL